MADSLLDNYNPLYDVHLRQYFALPHMQRHLRNIGLLQNEEADMNGESEMYARHHAMMDMMLRNREAQLAKLADLQKKLDAAEKVEICRRIRSGVSSPESLRRAKPSRSLSRGRQGVAGRVRRSSTSTDDKDLIKKIESENDEPSTENASHVYNRLSANVGKYRYLHKLDDDTLSSYMEQLRKQLNRLERFREVSFGPHSVARHQSEPQQSWFFRRRSVSTTKRRPTRSTSRKRDEPIRVHKPMQKDMENGGTLPALYVTGVSAPKAAQTGKQPRRGRQRPSQRGHAAKAVAAAGLQNGVQEGGTAVVVNREMSAPEAFTTTNGIDEISEPLVNVPQMMMKTAVKAALSEPSEAETNEETSVVEHYENGGQEEGRDSRTNTEEKVENEEEAEVVKVSENYAEAGEAQPAEEEEHDEREEEHLRGKRSIGESEQEEESAPQHEEKEEERDEVGGLETKQEEQEEVSSEMEKAEESEEGGAIAHIEMESGEQPEVVGDESEPVEEEQQNEEEKLEGAESVGEQDVEHEITEHHIEQLEVSHQTPVDEEGGDENEPPSLSPEVPAAVEKPEDELEVEEKESVTQHKEEEEEEEELTEAKEHAEDEEAGEDDHPLEEGVEVGETPEDAEHEGEDGAETIADVEPAAILEIHRDLTHETREEERTEEHEGATEDEGHTQETAESLHEEAEEAQPEQDDGKVEEIEQASEAHIFDHEETERETPAEHHEEDELRRSPSPEAEIAQHSEGDVENIDEEPTKEHSGEEEQNEVDEEAKEEPHEEESKSIGKEEEDGYAPSEEHDKDESEHVAVTEEEKTETEEPTRSGDERDEEAGERDQPEGEPEGERRADETEQLDGDKEGDSEPRTESVAGEAEEVIIAAKEEADKDEEASAEGEEESGKYDGEDRLDEAERELPTPDETRREEAEEKADEENERQPSPATEEVREEVEEGNEDEDVGVAGQHEEPEEGTVDEHEPHKVEDEDEHEEHKVVDDDEHAEDEHEHEEHDVHSAVISEGGEAEISRQDEDEAQKEEVGEENEEEEVKRNESPLEADHTEEEFTNHKDAEAEEEELHAETVVEVGENGKKEASEGGSERERNRADEENEEKEHWEEGHEVEQSEERVTEAPDELEGFHEEHIETGNKEEDEGAPEVHSLIETSFEHHSTHVEGIRSDGDPAEEDENANHSISSKHNGRASDSESLGNVTHKTDDEEDDARTMEQSPSPVQMPKNTPRVTSEDDPNEKENEDDVSETSEKNAESRRYSDVVEESKI